MHKIPVVFCFDDNLLLPAGVCIESLLKHAKKDTYYDIFIIHDQHCDFPESGYLEKLKDQYSSFSIQYRSAGNIFTDAFQIRGITHSTYYRLLIPELVPEYDKVMYHDVDVIFRDDLRQIFEETQLQDYYIAGVVSPLSDDKDFSSHVEQLNLRAEDYILAGNIMMNLGLMRKDGITELFRQMVKESSYKYQDMDIINIACQGRIERLPPAFCGTIEIFELALKRPKQTLYSDQELEDALSRGIIHYNGVKPWNNWCPNLDIWWEFYRKSVFYDPLYYFDFFYQKLDEYDRLPLLKRIKILVRYFSKGRLNN